MDELDTYARSLARLRGLEIDVVTTFGRDVGMTSAEFRRSASGRCGRQSQTWVRTADGWRIVTAHVSQADVAVAAA